MVSYLFNKENILDEFYSYADEINKEISKHKAGGEKFISVWDGIDKSLYESARIDGANRLKRVWHVDIPAILPVISIQLILRFGHIMSVGYEKVYLMQNSVNLPVSEIISTHVYKRGIQDGDLSYGAAVGLMNTFINTTLVVLVNWITTKLTDGEGGLF